ncbi:MAG: thioredoxin family protein [Thermoguttaceae bacterium]|nr:thioredoxin family protein [Thermoguttaceae bacterium]
MPKQLFCALLLFLAAAASSAADPPRITGAILPHGGQEHIWTAPEGAEGDPVAWLVVHGEHPGAYTYSMDESNAAAGGYPTRVAASFRGADAPFLLGEFKGARPVTPAGPPDAVLREWVDSFDVIAPVWRKAGAPPADDPLEAVSRSAPEAEFDALFCDEKFCTPQRGTVSFEISRDAAPLETLLSCARELSEIKIEPAPHGVLSAGDDAGGRSPASGSLARNLLYAFLGGMILNIMPCVLPVIGLKIVSFFDQAGQRRRRAFLLNVCYTAGILSVFTVLALMSVGLSYLFTYGLFQIVMGCVVFIMALNLIGVWEIVLPGFLGGRKSGELMGKEGGLGAWFKGVITTLLAIPCGAPLLSPALVWTDALIKNGSAVSVLLIYWVIGLGMAAPFLAIGAFPELLRFLPRPGAWMETFKKVMGFVLLPAVIWILYSMPISFILPTVSLLAALGFACWLLGRGRFNPDRKRLVPWLAASAVVLITLLFSFRMPFLNRGGAYPLPTLQGAFQQKLFRWGVRAAREGELAETDWRLFDQKVFDAALLDGRPVAIDFTADWCMNCKVLELTVLHAPEVDTLLHQKGVVTMTGDWTRRDQTEESRAVGDLLSRYGGQQVPVLMIFTLDRLDDPIVLRGLFTKETLIKELEAL